jgi:GNAT superfamily N-acetyltransferase
MNMDEDIVVRAATVLDTEALVQFTVEEAREAEGRVLDRETARRGVEAAFGSAPAARYWVGTLGPEGPPLACASVTLEWSDWTGGYYWWLQSVYVAPAMRGHRVFGLLVDAISQAARAAGAAELRLLVHAQNAPAFAAYRRSGFEELPYRVMRRRL